MSPAADENLALSLRILTEEIAKMGGLVEKMVQASLSALIRHHIPRAKRVVADDAQVDEAQRRVEALAESILAEHKLHDKAIREVVSALRIASDLERIGDHAKNCAKRVIALEGFSAPGQVAEGLEHMADMALEQLNTVLDAYTSQDRYAALEVRNRDDEVDAIYDSLFRQLLAAMSQGPDTVAQGVHLLFFAKNFERIGDHVTNIAEAIHYVVTGEQPSETRLRGDRTALLTPPELINTPSA